MSEKFPDDVMRWLDALAAARIAGAALPIDAVPGTLDLSDLAVGYELQREFVASWQRQAGDVSVGGYKGALTGSAAQASMGIDEALSGVLLQQNQLADGAVINTADFARPMLETELAFRVKPDQPAITADASVAEVASCFDAVAPAIELPDAGVTDRSKLTATMMAVVGAFAACHLIGSPQALDDYEPNAETVRFLCGDELLHDATGSDAMGDQWQSLHWIVTKVLGQGYTLQPGQWVMTGSLGAVQPAKPGAYRAQFSRLGEVHFQLT